MKTEFYNFKYRIKELYINHLTKTQVAALFLLLSQNEGWYIPIHIYMPKK